MENPKKKLTSKSTDFKTKFLSKKNNEFKIKSFNEIKNPMFDNKGSIINQIIRNKIDIKKGNYK